MAGETFIKLVNGQPAEARGIQSSAGAGDAGKLTALDSTGKLHESMMPVGVGPDVEVMNASGALSAGDFVNVFDDSGTRKARKADSSTPYRAHGFVLAGVSDGQPATVFTRGTNSAITLAAANAGAPVYLSTTGGITTTAPTTVAHIVQEVGVCVGANTIEVALQQPITRA